MVITENIKRKFEECIGNTIIFCTELNQLYILGQVYEEITGISAFKGFKEDTNTFTLQTDIECYFNKTNYGWQDGYNYKYFLNETSYNNNNFNKTITFNEIMNVEKSYELW
jgi:hypothetical protein